MKVTKDIRKIWKQEVEFGDIIKMYDHSGISTVTLGNAIRTGECSEKTFKAINAYLLQKKGETKKIETEFIQQYNA